MKVKVLLSSLGLGIFLSYAVLANEDEKPQWRCEKTSDGETIPVEAKTRDECKQKGGKWTKVEQGKSGHDHDSHNYDDNYGNKAGKKKK